MISLGDADIDNVLNDLDESDVDDGRSDDEIDMLPTSRNEELLRQIMDSDDTDEDPDYVPVDENNSDSGEEQPTTSKKRSKVPTMHKLQLFILLYS